jgi:hypothetical protein
VQTGGMNTMMRVDVDRHGACFVSRELAEEEVERILTMRQSVCDRYGLSEKKWLPRLQQEEVKKDLFENWKEEKA